MNLSHSIALLGALALAGPAPFPASAAGPGPVNKKIPIILDTDIGDDIDDTWALAFALRSPALDVRLVLGDYGRNRYRARLLARILERAGRTDIPVGVGLDIEPRGDKGRQAAWIGDYRLEAYPGTVHPDGVGAMIDLILRSPDPITLVAIGPLPNVAEALRREPRIAGRARFVGMHGSVRLGYAGKPEPAAEWNVRAAPAACRAVLAAPWEVTITPLDTCGLVVLDGDRYARVRDSGDPIARIVMENYRAWAAASNKPGLREQPATRSSTLFDTVAVYLAAAEDLCRIETLGLRVTDDGFTQPDRDAKPVRAAMAWNELDGFEELLVRRITSPGTQPHGATPSRP